MTLRKGFKKLNLEREQIKTLATKLSVDRHQSLL